jgi:hypothetical protein
MHVVLKGKNGGAWATGLPEDRLEEPGIKERILAVFPVGEDGGRKAKEFALEYGMTDAQRACPRRGKIVKGDLLAQGPGDFKYEPPSPCPDCGATPVPAFSKYYKHP